MHDIDRNQLESEAEMGMGPMHEQDQEQEMEGELEGESMLRSLFAEAEQEVEGEGEYGAEAEAEGEAEYEGEQEAESPLGEEQEMELAAQLLEVGSDAELEYFMGNLFRRAARGVRSFARSRHGRMLGGMVKRLAKKALPIAGRAVGTYFGGPVGARLGGRLGRFASNLFELELEGLSPEDREFEIARQVVRLGAAAASRAARAPRTAPPRVVAQRAFTSAARVFAPGLLRRRIPDGAGPGVPGIRPRRRRGIGRRPNGRGQIEPVYGEPGLQPGGKWYWSGRQIVITGL